MIASGKFIKNDVTLAGASTMDLAPTILYLLGQPIPQDMDGRVLLELLDGEFKNDNPVRYENRPFIVPEEMRLY